MAKHLEVERSDEEIKDVVKATSFQAMSQIPKNKDLNLVRKGKQLIKTSLIYGILIDVKISAPIFAYRFYYAP